jgi:hypothetical protein
MSIPKTLDNFKIVLQDGTTYDMADDFSVLVRSFRISSPKPIRHTEQFEGRDGQIRVGKDYGERAITAVCSFFAVDIPDSKLLRDDLIRVLYSREPFYIISDANPGKRWLVEVSDSFTPELLGMYGEFTVDFVSDSTFSESIGTTLDPLSSDEELWQVGQGLTEEEPVYTQTTSAFSIYNAGDVTIDPREFPLVITYKGASSKLSISNTTNGSTWTYNGDTTSNDTVKLDGVRSLKNEVSIFKDTNRSLITLQPGRNDFTVLGASGSFTIEFDFRFYYL